MALFLAHIEKVPHLTLHRLKDLLAAERGVVVSHDTVWRFLRGEGRCSPATSSSSTISAAIAQAPSARPSSAPVQELAFLPPYSPDLNPIEQVFAKVKHGMRMAQARTVDAIHESIAGLVAGISHVECESYLGNAGYVSA